MNELRRIVYLVDDDPAIRKSLPRALASRGMNVEVFASAQSFLRDYSPGDVGCVLLDLSMPDMDGLELQKELNRRGIKIPLIFVTGHGDVAQSVKALKAGAVDFLEKPFRLEILLQRIDEAFAQCLAEIEEMNFVDAIRARIQRLTKREKDVLRLLVSNSAQLSNKDVARKLGISNRTVDHHRARIMDKTQARSITELAKFAEIAGETLADE